MSIGETQICNKAIAKLGGEPILNFNDDTTEQARWCRENFDDARDGCLEDADWSFASTYAQLSALGTQPVAQFDWAYLKPVDSIRILEASQDRVSMFPVTNWQVVGKTIQTANGGNANVQVTEGTPPPLYIRYTRRVEVIAEWSSNFRDAMTWRLAAELSLAMTESQSSFDRCWSIYIAKLENAGTQDGQVGRARRTQASALVDVRTGAYNSLAGGYFSAY